MKVLIASLFSGLLFGFGLVVSGMSNPARVLNFLDFRSILVYFSTNCRAMHFFSKMFWVISSAAIYSCDLHCS